MRGRATRWATAVAVAAVAAVAFATLAPMVGAEEKTPGPGKPGSVAKSVSGQADVNAQAAGGPVVIMGIDAEDGGPGGHGPISVYISVLNSIKANVTNGGTGGILVIGAGKSPTDDPTEFWNAAAAGAGLAVTYVNGAANITSQSFANFQVIGVASGDGDTSDGLTAAESEALAGRQTDIANFVNTGGGLLVFSQGFDDPTTSAYAFLGGIGAFTFETNLSYEDIDPTAAGTAIGITDDLDVCCWHDIYLTYPSFLSPLALVSATEGTELQGKVAALGGVSVFIGPPPPEPPVLQPTFTG